MCDYSLHHAKSRPAKVGDKLTTRDFGFGTRGFAASQDKNVVVCACYRGLNCPLPERLNARPARWLGYESDPPQDRGFPAGQAEDGSGSFFSATGIDPLLKDRRRLEYHHATRRTEQKSIA